ncbi:hypothetical protein ACX93W_21810 [Paenibacillus sp. CAU 1782]
MPYTKPVITDPYYDCPVWIENEIERKPFICLTADSSEHDVELFLLHLFGYSDIDVSQTMKASFDEILQEDEKAISGGVAFYRDEHRYILPSCCCGLEELIEICASVKEKKSPWLGHDPWPGITYHDGYARVWSDDPDKESTEHFYVDFTYNELEESLEKTKGELVGFIEGPLFHWVFKRDAELARQFKLKMYMWFLKGEK